MTQDCLIEVSIEDQLLRLTDAAGHSMFPVSTARNGVGSENGTGKTPLGWHRVAARIGAGLPINAVLVGRRFSGEIYSAELARQYPDRDWILSRILWLQGMEVGRNRLGNVDSMRRYIYIHGTPDTEPMGVPKSHGCIRMRNEHLLELFDRVPAGSPVWIQVASFARIPCRHL